MAKMALVYYKTRICIIQYHVTEIFQMNICILNKSENYVTHYFYFIILLQDFILLQNILKFH